jgi:mono/diheme cytochrome c family protein
MKAGSKVSVLNLLVAAGVALAAAAYGAHRSEARALPAFQEPDGKALYLKNCRKCHGVKGVPSAEARRKYKEIETLADPELLAKVSDDSMVTVMTDGAGDDMKSFKKKLTPDEMLAVAKYVRTLAEAPASAPPQ